MPPAAMQAAGMAAKDTATYANQIGRIASGLWADSPRSTPDPLLVAALIECSFCLFVAGVQVRLVWRSNGSRCTSTLADTA